LTTKERGKASRGIFGGEPGEKSREPEGPAKTTLDLVEEGGLGGGSSADRKVVPRRKRSKIVQGRTKGSRANEWGENQ